MRRVLRNTALTGFMAVTGPALAQQPPTLICHYPEGHLAAGGVPEQTLTYVLSDGTWRETTTTFQKNETIAANGSGIRLDTLTTIDRMSGVATIAFFDPGHGGMPFGSVQGQCKPAGARQF